MKLKTLLIASSILLSIHSCRKERFESKIISKELLHGEWFQDNQWDDEHSRREVYHFTADEKFEITISVVDRSTNQVKGYLTKRTGTFNLKADSLIFQHLEQYSSDAGGYKPLNELKYSTLNFRGSYKPVFSAKNTLLTLELKCPDNAVCIPNPRLTRLKGR